MVPFSRALNQQIDLYHRVALESLGRRDDAIPDSPTTKIVPPLLVRVMTTTRTSWSKIADHAGHSVRPKGIDCWWSVSLSQNLMVTWFLHRNVIWLMLRSKFTTPSSPVPSVRGCEEDVSSEFFLFPNSPDRTVRQLVSYRDLRQCLLILMSKWVSSLFIS